MKKNKKDINISACMMVKNEEEMLPRCLNSIKHLIDELIIVDTGSTDKTIEIAESFGAKIYHHPWENNFSKHRNQSLGYATGDWIIQIDADEELNGYQLKKNDLKKMFSRAPKDLHCFLIKMLDKNKKGETVSETEMIRIFRNHVGVHFTGIVHNRPQYSGKVGHSDIQFFHYGYALSDAQMQAKYKRTSGLLFKRIEADPQDHDAYFYLYQVHSEMKEKQKAVEYAEKCLELVKEKNINFTEVSFYYSLYHGLASTYLKSGHYDLAQSFIRKGLEVLPEEPDLYYDLAALGYFSNQPDLSVEGGKNYLRVIDGFRKDSLKAGTRFIFTTSKKAELSVSFWLMLGLISLNQLADFLELWEKYKEDMVDKPSFQKLLFDALERKEAFEYLEPVAVFLFNEQEKVPVENHKIVFSFLLFYISEKMAHQKEQGDELKTLFENVAGQYLDNVDSYRNIPTGDAVIIADFLLGNNMDKFFLDLTLTIFERELAGQIKLIDSNKTIMQGYELIAESLGKDRKGRLFELLCRNICEKLSKTTEAGAFEPTSEKTGLPVAVNESQKMVSGQHKPAGSMTTNIPLVSIGLPVFNGGEDLDKAIKSILNQDFEDFELIICDNCSTDNTEAICRRYAGQDKRIYYNRWTQNYGLLRNWQTAAGFARGKFFAFAQHDNTYHPEFLSACLKEYKTDKNKSYVSVYPQVNLVYKDGRTRPYSDRINAIQESPVERYLHVLKNLDLTNCGLGLYRTEMVKTNKIFYGALSSRKTNLLYGDHSGTTEDALRGKIKRIDQVLLNRKMSDYKYAKSMEERTVKLINAIGWYMINDAISLQYVKIISRQMDIINYTPLSFSEKDFLIKETIKILKERFGQQMLAEINRAVALVKKHQFYTTWDGKKLPEKTLNTLPAFKRHYITMLYRELEDALLIFPELDELRAAVQTCRNQI